MTHTRTSLLVFTLSLAAWTLAGLLTADPVHGERKINFLVEQEDTTAVQDSLVNGLTPAADSCYSAYPESLLTPSFAKVFRIYGSEAALNGWGPPTLPPWTQAQWDTFMNAVFDGDTTTTTDVFPLVWDYFCLKDRAAAEDSVNYVAADSTYTQLEISLYHSKNWCPAPNPTCGTGYCDTTQAGPEPNLWGTADANTIVYATNELYKDGCSLKAVFNLTPPLEAAQGIVFAHELQHIADGVNSNKKPIAGNYGEWLSTAGEYVAGNRWTEEFQGMGHLNTSLYTPLLGDRYNLYRLWDAYLFAHFSGGSGPEDDLLYKSLRYVLPQEINPTRSLYGMAQLLESDFPGALPGSDGDEMLGNLYQRFAMARFADDSTDYAGGIYGFAASGVSPRHFGWFEWVNTCSTRVAWIPLDVTLGDELVGAAAETVSAYVDTVDTAFPDLSRNLTLSTLGLEYLILRADSTYFSGNPPQTLSVQLQTPASLPSGIEARISYLEYASEVGKLYDQPLRAATESVPISLDGGALDTTFEVDEFGDSTRAVVVVVSLVETTVPSTWLPGNTPVPITMIYDYAPDTTFVPSGQENIQNAIDAGADGDIVMVAGKFGGTAYNESLTLTRHVRIIGTDTGNGLPVLNGGTDSSAVAFDSTATNFTTLENFTIRGGSREMILLEGNGILRDCTLEGTDPTYGIRAMDTGSQAAVDNCAITRDSGTAVYLDNGTATVTDCTIRVGDGSAANTGIATTAGFDGDSVTWCIADSTGSTLPYGTGGAAKGEGCVTEDPLFSAVGDYSLRVDSYGNRGNNSNGSGPGGSGGKPIGISTDLYMYGTLTRTTTVLADTVNFLGDATVATGDTLTLEDSIILAPRSDNQSGGYDYGEAELIVEGTLEAQAPLLGSAEGSPEPGDWYGIVVKSGGHANLDGVILENSTYGIRYESAGNDTVSGCTFRLNQINDIWVNGLSAAGALTVEDNQFLVSGARAFDMPYDNSGVTVSGNTITKVATWAEGLWMRQGSTSSPEITDNTISGFTLAQGVRVNAGSPELTKNEISDSKYGILLTAGSAVIGLQSDSSSDNLIHDNTDGLRCSGSSVTPTVRNSQFYDNSIGITALRSAAPDLGLFGSGYHGLNSIYQNGTCVKNSTTSTVMAIGNWWGACSAPSCFSGSVVANDWKCSQPAGAREWDIGPMKPPARRMVLVGTWPNPTRAGSNLVLTLEDGYAEIGFQIFDIAGRRVTTVNAGELGPGRHTVRWDGRNESGSRVGSGFYFAQVRGNDRHLGTLKMLVIR